MFIPCWKLPVGTNSERRPLYVWYTRMAYFQGRTVIFRECISVKIPVVLGEQATTGASIQGTFLFNGFHFERCYGGPWKTSRRLKPTNGEICPFQLGIFWGSVLNFQGPGEIFWWEWLSLKLRNGTWNTGVGVDEFPFGFRLPGEFELFGDWVVCTPVRYWTSDFGNSDDDTNQNMCSLLPEFFATWSVGFLGDDSG